MIRCVTLLAASLFAAVPAAAQFARNFPATALRGEMTVLQPPEVLLNGRPARLAPGSRIRDENNLLVMSGALVQRKVVVHYTVDSVGLLLDVWLLTPAERARQPWPATPAQAQAWSFDPIGQSWRRP